MTAKDDGINASDGSGSDAAPGQATEGAAVRISGGMVTVKAGGDGIDSNGDLTISGGTVVVDGPSDGGNAPLDYDGKGVITGGTVFVTGDSGMFQTLNDSGSTQKSLVVSLNSTQGAGTKVTIADSKGNVVYENTATTQAFNTLLFSAADLKQDENYTVTVGNESRTVTVSDSANINSENGGNHGAPGSKPEGRPNGQRPEGRPENGGQQGSRDQNGKRPEGRPEDGQQGSRNQNGKRPEGRLENGDRQGGRGQNGKRPEGRPENGGQQGKQRGKRSVDDNDKSKGTCSCSADCSCRAK